MKFLENDKIILRAVEPEDLELLYRWENDSSIWIAGNTRAPYSRYQLKNYISHSPTDIYDINRFCLLSKIYINKASVERLKSHPYLTFSKAKEIYELRRDRGKLKNIDELRKLHSLSDEDLLKIEPYLSFE